MAAQNSVADIGVKLTADTSGFDAALDRSSRKLQALRGTTSAPAPGRSAGAATTVAGGGGGGDNRYVVKGEVTFTKAQVSSALRAATDGLSVSVPISITKSSITSAKTMIMEGIGTIPVTISPRFAGSGPQSITNVMGAVLGMQYGISQTQGRALFKETVQKIGPMPKGAAMGGPVTANTPVVVGERRPEVFVPKVNGRILPNADNFRRELSNLTLMEREIYQRQRNIEQSLMAVPQAMGGMRRMGGGMVHARYGSRPLREGELNAAFPYRRQRNIIERFIQDQGRPSLDARDWYAIARAQVLGDMADFNFQGDPQVGMFAAANLSPGMAWPHNRALFRQLLQGVPPSQMAASGFVPGFGNVGGGVSRGRGPFERAHRVLNARDLSEALRLSTGPKVNPFGLNLTGLDPDVFTNDARMTQIATNDQQVVRMVRGEPRVGVIGSVGEGPFRRNTIKAYESLFRKYGPALDAEHIAEFQSTLWSAKGRGADLGDDWVRTDAGIAIPRHPGLLVPVRRMAGGPASRRGGGGMVHRGMGGLVGRLAQAQASQGLRFPGPVGEEFERLAAERWGLTDDPMKAGWLSPRGRYLDFSGGYPSRSIEHRAAGALFGMRGDAQWDAYEAMMERNWMRVAQFSPDWAGFEMMKPATREQISRLVADQRFLRTPDVAIDWRDFMGGAGGLRGKGPALGSMLQQMNDLLAGGGGRSSAQIAEALKQKGFMGGGFARHAGVGSRALKDTLAKWQAGLPAGGTYPVQPGAVVPTSGHALGIPQLLGGTTIDVQIDPSNLTRGMVRDFLTAFHTQRKLGAPFVGTWLDPDTGLLSVDPSTVIPRKRDADLVLRAGGEKAAFDLRTFEEWFQSGRAVRAAPERILDAVFSGTGLGRMAGGSGRGHGLYIVGEIGKELFVPDAMQDLIPKEVMDQIPKAMGGAQVIGKKRNELFSPPTDGWIIPHRLLDKVRHLMPGRAPGGPVEGSASGAPRIPGSFSENFIGWVDNEGNVHAYGGGAMGFRGGAIIGRASDFDPRLLGPRFPGRSGILGPTEMGLTGRGITGASYPDAALEMFANARPPSASFVAGVTDINRPFGTAPVLGEGTPLPERLPFGEEQATERYRPGFNPRIGSDRGQSGPLLDRIREVQLRAEQVTVSQPRQVRVGEPEAQYGGEAGFVGPSGVNFAGGQPRLPRGTRIPERIQEQFAQQREEFSFAAQLQAARTPRGLAAVLGTTVLGRTGQLAQISEQRRALTRVQEAVGGIFREFGEEEGLQRLTVLKELTGDLTIARGKEVDTVRQQINAVTGNNAVLREYVDAQENFNQKQKEGLPGAAQGLKNLAAASLAVFGYGLATRAVGVVVASATPALATFVDSMRGWQATSDAVTTSLAAQTRQASGNVQAVIAQQAATAGLSASTMEYVESLLTATTLVKAGAQASKQTEDLFKAARGAGAVPAGLFGGYGGLFGGPVGAEFLGGGPGFTETMAGAFNALRSTNATSDLLRGLEPAANDFLGGLEYLFNGGYYDDLARRIGARTPAESFTGGGFRVPQEVMDVGTAYGATEAQIRAVAYGIEQSTPRYQAIGATNLPIRDDAVGAPFWGEVLSALEDGARTFEAAGPFDAAAGFDESAQRARTQLLKDYNAAQDRGQEALASNLEVTFRLARSWEEVAAAENIARESGDIHSAGLARNAGVIMEVNGQIARDVQTFRDAITQGAIGKTIVDPEVWAADNRRALRAQFEQITLTAQRQMRLVPFETSQQLVTQPLITPGAGFFSGTGAGAVRAAGGGALSGEISGILSQTESTQARIGRIAERGWAEMRADVEEFAPDMVGQFDNLQEKALGSQAAIQSMTTRLLDIQQAANQANWDNQIRIAQRSLGDALGMLGEAGGTRLGFLQREQFLASRASQSLGLAAQRISLVSQELSIALQKRQIATQLAVAQFQAPGETGEERFARQREAIIRASIQRRQVGLQEQGLGINQQQFRIAGQQFQLAGRIWSENARRTAVDAARAIEVMRKARQAEAFAVAAQARIAAESQVAANVMRRINVITGRAGSNFGSALGTAANKAAQFAGDIAEASAIIRRAAGIGPRSATVLTRDGQTRRSAPGFLGTFSAPTSMTLGEAGTETVAILRNPRRHMVDFGSGGGGPTSIQINIVNPSVRNDSDINRLASMVANKVERALASKGERMGLRSPSY